MSTTEESVNPANADYEGKSLGVFWREQIEHADQLTDTWQKRAALIVERYRDERSFTERGNSRFNILWSNVQVLRPSLYGRPAKPEVTRRYMDADPVGRLASTILERCLDYEVEQFPDFDEGMSGVVEDRLLPGRGTIWMRFEGFDNNGVQISSSEEVVNEGISEAHAPVDYVYWRDFYHSPARTWDEVWWVARAVYLTMKEGVARFGERFRNVPLSDYQADNSKRKKDRNNTPQFAQKAKVYEIWNKRTAKVCWVAKGLDIALDEREDPLKLEEFFPCPKPLFATTTNGSLIPVPDYIEYQDQAEELDSITARIDHLVDAVRAAGVCNGEFKELQRLLQSKGNVLIPVSNWAGLAEKGGLAGAFELIDLSTIVTALSALYQAREAAKIIIYEICGISDILRGSSKAEETLGAQQLKVQTGSLRLRSSQADVARFASDIFKLKAQIICRFYPPQLLIDMSGIRGTDDGQNPELVADAIILLQDGSMRDFHIAVESDSLAQIDEDAEKQAASEAIAAISGFLKEALPVVGQVPQLLPMFTEMLLFITRRFRAGRPLEAAIENGMKALKEAAEAPKGPTPEEIEMQMQAQAEQARIQADTQAAQMKEQFAAERETEKLAAESQLEQMKSQLDQQQSAFDAQMKMQTEAQKLEVERYKIDADNATKLRIAEMEQQTKIDIAGQQSQTTLRTAQMGANKGDPGDSDSLTTNSDIENAVSRLAEHFEASIPAPPVDRTDELAQALAQVQQMIASLPAMLKPPTPPPAPPAPREVPRKEEPKKRGGYTIERDENGKMTRLVPLD